MLPKPVIPDFAKAPGLPIVAVTARTMYLAFSFRKQAWGILGRANLSECQTETLSNGFKSSQTYRQNIFFQIL